MQDRHVLRTILALTAPLAALIALGVYLGGGTIRAAVFAALKLAVIR